MKREGNASSLYSIEKFRSAAWNSVSATTLCARKIDPKTLLESVQLVPAGTIGVARLVSREGYAYIKP